MIVDNVVDLIDIDDDHLSDVPQVGSNYIHAFVKYIGVTDNKMHLILDTDRLVDYNEMGAWSQGTEGAEA